LDDSARVQVAFEEFINAVKHRAKYEQKHGAFGGGMAQ
jgi:hypothetical protein